MPSSNQDFFKKVILGIKTKVTRLIEVLEKKDKLIDWYYFLIHGDPSPYFDVVVSLKISVSEETLKNSLRHLTYCSTPEKLDRNFGETISNVTRAQLKNDDIEEGWRLVGEQSQWVIELINAYKEDALTIGQFTQFIHFFTNAVGLGMHSVMAVDGFYQF
jgi:hypothetical protein